ncbi:MAG: FadR family transcriptional regulator [Synergistaceae bacterium]|nr:FadR family transcriptional regulator [Synergistaceae bacterium]
MAAIRKNNFLKGKKELIQDKLLSLIKEEKLGEGDKLPSERELAQEFGVSRNILREAVVSLSATGILEVRERQGIFVKNSYQDSSLEILKSLQMLPADFVSYQMEVRMIISVPATELAALRRTEEDLRKIHECFDSFVSCPFVTKEEQERNGKWEALLHRLVNDAAHNPILSRINESINQLVESNNSLVHHHILHEPGWIEHIQKQHRMIIQALEEKNSTVAGNVLKEHLIESVNMIKEKYPNLISEIKHPYWEIS